MTHLLFPGRHHLLTKFQHDYLESVTTQPTESLVDLHGDSLASVSPFESIIWCLTSANHSNTRRNPIAANRREAAIERLDRELTVDSFVFPIDDLGTTPRFAEYVIKKIGVDSRGRFRLSPANTIVACSTPSVIEMYQALGYRILPVELENWEAETYSALTPWEVLNQLIEAGLAGEQWETLPLYLEMTTEATRHVYRKYAIEDLIVSLHRSPLLTEDGDLTETRNYNTYVRSFDDGAERKFATVEHQIRPGRIVDIGCCTGALLQQISCDDRFRESDLFGIEVARPLFVECQHRKQQGHFENENVFFYQQDFSASPIFPGDSIDTFLTFSLTHEIESYGGRESLMRFIQLIEQQTAPRGRWINVDVVGPENKDQQVAAWLNPDDGCEPVASSGSAIDSDERETLRDQLKALSTFERFLQFAKDFRREEGYRLNYQRCEQRPSTVILKLGDLCEFLSKKDYVDNWKSEMHETFCFWSFTEWKAAVESSGFRVLPESAAFQNPWIIENRYQPCVKIWDATTGEELPFPVTNMLVVAEKAY